MSVFLKLALPLLLVASVPLLVLPTTARPKPQRKPKVVQRRPTRHVPHLSSRGALARAADLARLDSLVQSGGKVIVVQKSQRELWLVEGGRSLKQYPVTVGKVTTAPKLRAGDWCTPEGVYYVARKNPQSKYYLALHLSYPNKEDADRGLQAGLISPAQHQRIYSALDRGALPPQNTALGYYIEIHGRSNRVEKGPDGALRLRGWTRGCVGLRDADIEEIYRWAPLGTPVVLLP